MLYFFKIISNLYINIVFIPCIKALKGNKIEGLNVSNK